MTNPISVTCLQECWLSAMHMDNVTMFNLDGYKIVFTTKPKLCSWWSKYICSQTVCSNFPNKY